MESVSVAPHVEGLLTNIKVFYTCDVPFLQTFVLCPEEIKIVPIYHPNELKNNFSKHLSSLKIYRFCGETKSLNQETSQSLSSIQQINLKWSLNVVCCFILTLPQFHERNIYSCYGFEIYIFYAKSVAFNIKISTAYRNICCTLDEPCKCIPSAVGQNTPSLNSTHRFPKDRNNKSNPSRSIASGVFLLLLLYVIQTILPVICKINQRKSHQFNTTTSQYRKVNRHTRHRNYVSAVSLSKAIKSIFLVYIICSCCFVWTNCEILTINNTNKNSHPEKGFHIGDHCIDSCSSIIEHSFCNTTTSTCQCKPSHNIEIQDGISCVSPKELFEQCNYHIQCRTKTEDSHCYQAKETNPKICICKPGFHHEAAHEIPLRYVCVYDSTGFLAYVQGVPAIVGLTIGLTILCFLLCFMFRLFARGQWPRSRGYADANIPPTIILEDGDDTQHQHKQIFIGPQEVNGTHVPIITPSPSQSSRRRGSGNNNSNYSSNGSGGNISSGVAKSSHQRKPSRRLSKDSRSSSEPYPAGSIIPLSRLASNDTEAEYEQHITIVPNPRAKRRGSMADHAFPELHSRAKAKGKAKQKEPENLLILTRTRTDRHGRRHSVAVPLIPPPDGEKFEGGYHVERNPITGGATLVPPESDSRHIRSRSNSSRRITSGGGNEKGTTLNQPSSQQKIPNINHSNGKQRPHTADLHVGRSRATSKSMKITSTSLSASSAAKSKQSPSDAKQHLQLPGASGSRYNRRHSYTPKSPPPNVSILTKEMSKLGVANNSGRGLSPRPSTKRRASTYNRRSSRSGFLHFLDLAIAN